MNYSQMSDESLRKSRDRLDERADELRRQGRRDEAAECDDQSVGIDRELARRTGKLVDAEIDADLARERHNAETERWMRNHPR